MSQSGGKLTWIFLTNIASFLFVSFNQNRIRSESKATRFAKKKEDLDMSIVFLLFFCRVPYKNPTILLGQFMDMLDRVRCCLDQFCVVNVSQLSGVLGSAGKAGGSAGAEPDPHLGQHLPTHTRSGQF